MYVDFIMYNCHFEDRLALFWGLENRVPDGWTLVFVNKENYYDDYLKSMYVDFIMYNCHFEDRLALFWGLENRVPLSR